MNVDASALMTVVVELTKSGVRMKVEAREGRLMASFEDGFYKSDGLAYLCVENGLLYLHSRYSGKDEICSYRDIVEHSRRWYEYSKDKFAGWATPPSIWAKLYAEHGVT